MAWLTDTAIVGVTWNLSRHTGSSVFELEDEGHGNYSPAQTKKVQHLRVRDRGCNQYCCPGRRWRSEVFHVRYTATAPTDQHHQADKILAYGDPTFSEKRGSEDMERSDEEERKVREPNRRTEAFVEAYYPKSSVPVVLNSGRTIRIQPAWLLAPVL